LNGSRQAGRFECTSALLSESFDISLRIRSESCRSMRVIESEAPLAQWSSPRLAQALRFLYDIGALDLRDDVDDRPYVLSLFGEELLESELARH